MSVMRNSRRRLATGGVIAAAALSLGVASALTATAATGAELTP